MGAVQLLDHVWRVGGAGPDAFTDTHDCHCYLIADDTGGLLIDAGTGLGAAAWRDTIAEVCDPATLTGVVVTHYHADHAGGAADAGVPIIASRETAEALAVADEDRTSLAVAREAGVYPAGYRLRPARVDRIVSGGEHLRAGGLSAEIVAAPGHSDGHLVVLATIGGRRVLFSGDVLFSGGRISMQALHDCRLDRYARTVIDLAGRDVDVLLPGHGEPVLGGAGTDIRRAADSFRRLVPPPNVL
jgi:glyoxylase-like metal-dependent hydrolase (beta-lactamase superfamily II)